MTYKVLVAFNSLNLNVLDLSGNPIADLPSYKAKLISMLNQLSELDGQDVTPPSPLSLSDDSRAAWSSESLLYEQVTKEEIVEANAWAKAEEARLAAEAEAAAAAE